MNIGLLVIIGILFLELILLVLKIYVMKKSIREIEQSFKYILKSDTNNVISITSEDKEIKTLTSSLNYKLNKTAPTAIVGTTGTLSTPYALNPNVKTEEGIDTSYSLEAGTLAPGESKTFNLYLWINENANNSIMGQNFEGKVLVYSYL